MHIRFLALILAISAGAASQVSPPGPPETTEVAAVSSKPAGKIRVLETRFVLNKGRLEVLYGGEKSCREDHRFVLQALKDVCVILRNSRYQVSVWSGEAEALLKSNSKPMLVKIYEIEMKTSRADPTMETFRKRIDAEKGYLRRMANSEAPVTCNYYFKADRLHLLAFYGFLDYYVGLDLDRLIEEVKLER